MKLRFRVLNLFLLPALLTLATAASATGEVEPDLYSPNLYRRLGLQDRSSLEAVKQAYRKLIRKYHADVYHGKDANEISVNLNEAYELLKDAGKKEVYDSLLKSGQSRNIQSNANPSEGRNDRSHYYEEALINVTELKAKHPEFSAYFDGVIASSIAPRLPTRPAFIVLPEIPHVWPSDTRLTSIILESGIDVLLVNLAYNVLTVPQWGGRMDVLWALVQKDRPRVSSLIGEFVYSDGWVNEHGAQVLNALIDRGYYTEVARSLLLAGGISTWIDGKWVPGKDWYSREDGVDLMRKLISKADAQALDHLDRGAFSSHLPIQGWVDAFHDIEEAHDLPYLSARTLRGVYDRYPELVKEPVPPCEHRVLKKAPLKLEMMVGKAGKKRKT